MRENIILNNIYIPNVSHYIWNKYSARKNSIIGFRSDDIYTEEVDNVKAVSLSVNNCF